jgi:hypothetical protein
VHLNEQRLNTIWQQKVFTKLLGLNYKIIYKKEVANAANDALSRKPVSSGTALPCLPISLSGWTNLSLVMNMISLPRMLLPRSLWMH